MLDNVRTSEEEDRTMKTKGKIWWFLYVIGYWKRKWERMGINNNVSFSS